ncbi:hypothetical protein HYDPIDRAFT_104547 [Hydnomerulius pinastri MD-312]|nr:hypothetical protein HYDPIDRAFT_104547 [Hydnomerulius pinastri MD-312]
MDHGSEDSAAEMAAEFEKFVWNVMMQPDREQVALEIGVLQSIYGNNAIHLRHPSRGASPEHTPDRDPPSAGEKAEAIRYVVSSNLPSHEGISICILASLPSSYPTSEWSPETVCVFDGLQSVLERCEAWYEDRLSQEKVSELVREHMLAHEQALQNNPAGEAVEDPRMPRPEPPLQDTALPEGIKLIEAEPIVDRKSVFVGRACRISHPSQVLDRHRYASSWSSDAVVLSGSAHSEQLNVR